MFKLKKSYLFALISSLYIALFFSVIFLVYHFFIAQISLIFYSFFTISLFVFSFLILTYRAEKFIYQRVKKIYDDVSLLENTTFKNSSVTTDMNTLAEEVKKYALDKKIEIESLKIREEYRREFLGNISHELKTPLFTVQGYISTLLDGAAEDKNIRQKYLERADKGVERLLYIIKDLDMISKLETGDMNLEIEKFTIVEMIQNVFDLLEMRASKKNITLTFDKKYTQKIFVKADKEKIQQVVSNLIVNSIKYGKEKGTTEVSIENITNSKIIIRITDNGEGIESQHIPRLFERFYRVDKSGARSEGGSGLGLAIVKHILEKHHQKIYVESKYGFGSEFSFTLEKAE